MTALRPVRSGPGFNVVADGQPIALVTMLPPPPAYGRREPAAGLIWHVYMLGDAWRATEPNGQPLFVGSFGRLADAVGTVEYLHLRRGCRFCTMPPHERGCRVARAEGSRPSRNLP